MIERLDKILLKIDIVFSLIVSILLVASLYEPGYLIGLCLSALLISVMLSFLMIFITSETTAFIFYNKDERVVSLRPVEKYADQVSLWVLLQFVIYSVAIPSSNKMPKGLKDQENFNNRITKSNDRITEVLTNESVVDVLYKGYAPDMKNEMEAFVRKTFKDEIRAIKQIRAEMKDVVARENKIHNQSRMRQIEREESERRAARDAKNEDVRMKANKMLNENYLSEVKQEEGDTDA